MKVSGFGTRTKAQVLEGRGTQRHFEIQSLGNGIFWGFQEVFSTTADAMLFRQNTRKTGNNAVETDCRNVPGSLFERFTDLNQFKYAFNVNQNWEKMLYNFLQGHRTRMQLKTI